VSEDGWVALVNRADYLHVQRWDGVFDPRADPVRPRDTLPPPDDLVRWLMEHPRLRVSEPQSVEVGGLSGFGLEVAVSTPLDRSPPECDGRRCVLLGRVAGEAEPVDVEVGQRAWFIVLGPPGDQFVIHYRAAVERVDHLTVVVERLLATFQFETSP
jgi:hypothetical protein